MKKSCCGSVDGCCHTRDPIVYINEKPNASEKKELCILRSSGQSSKGSQTWSGGLIFLLTYPLSPNLGNALLLFIYYCLVCCGWVEEEEGSIRDTTFAHIGRWRADLIRLICLDDGNTETFPGFVRTTYLFQGPAKVKCNPTGPPRGISHCTKHQALKRMKERTKREFRSKIVGNWWRRRWGADVVWK